ncbi:MAG: hypothetical protein RIF36_24930 [Imperialibacter sp.]|uniref:hypothetical protein n=1 Tax=Imperialibacter sp. TaxID=2038411 RepID=UPI0032EDC3BA
MRLLAIIVCSLISIGLTQASGQNFKVLKSDNCFINNQKLKKGVQINGGLVQINESGYLKVRHFQNYEYQFRGPCLVNLDSLDNILIDRTQMLMNTFGHDRAYISRCKEQSSFSLDNPPRIEATDTTRIDITWEFEAEKFFIHLRNVYDEYLLVEECQDKTYQIDFSNFVNLPDQTLIFFVTTSDVCQRSNYGGAIIKGSRKMD